MLPFRYTLPLSKISRNPDFYQRIANAWLLRLDFIDTHNMTPSQNARHMVLSAKASQVFGAAQMALLLGDK